MKTKNSIREIRELRGFSQAWVAEALGTSQSQIDRLEKGQRRLTVEWLNKLADFFDTDIGTLLGNRSPTINQERQEDNTTPIHATIPHNSSVIFDILERIHLSVPTPYGIQKSNIINDVIGFIISNNSLSERWSDGDILYGDKSINYKDESAEALLRDYFRCPFLVFIGNTKCFCARLVESSGDSFSFRAEHPNGNWEKFSYRRDDIISMHRILEWEELLYGWRRVSFFQTFEDAVNKFNAK
ncbi:helix-turn-helix domain-containing protein [Gluconobacter cerinus]|uniref:helix-turn-helix domain-containing protein n=1 Tax=Gluconobacter cerinus TaxID=38307 RepID=UPI001B8B6318|nr:helix-turn-helix transcriptional regulator [Gluconobacter cerinus]MBS1067162.1 helix-turn-helix transcriptional regulator [Gluconobacter cerinus]